MNKKYIFYPFFLLLLLFAAYLWRYDRQMKEQMLQAGMLDPAAFTTDEHKRTLLIPTDPNDVLRFYQSLKDVHEVFEMHGLPYWISCGTLLGAVRHQGMIPWDDDIDICLDRQYEHAFLRLRDTFEALGYRICKTVFGYKIFPIDGKQYSRKTWRSFFTEKTYVTREFTYPFIDVFITKEEDGKVVYDRRKARHGWYKDVVLTSELYPLKQWKFGELSVYGPNDAHSFLTRMYGPDWNEVTYRDYNHSQEKRALIMIVPLRSEDRHPALPTGPLQDRVKTQ